MWVCYWCYYVILFLFNVNMSKEDPIQYNSQELIQAIGNIFEDKISELIDDKMAKIMEEKMKLVNYKLNKIDASLVNVKEKSENQSIEATSIKEFILDINKETEVSLDKIKQDTSAIENSVLKLTDIDNTVKFIKMVGQCPPSDGFLLSPDSSQCFKPYRRVKDEYEHRSHHENRNWDKADRLCRDAGMILSEPSDSNVAWLQRTLYEKFGDGDYWVGIRGTDRGNESYQFQHSGRYLPSNSTSWWYGNPTQDGARDYCGVLLAKSYNIKSYPGRAIMDEGCGMGYYHICESVLV